MRAALYTRVSAVDMSTTAAELLAELRRYTKDVRGWTVSIELADRGPGITGRREGLARLIELIQGGSIDVVVTTSLARLCRSQSHVLDIAELLAADPKAGREELGLVALVDMVDTTTHDGRARWRDAVDLFRGVRQAQRSEAIKLARLKAAVREVDDNWGRPVAAINPLELAAYWHGSPQKRPLSIREISRRLGYAQGTVRRRIRELLDAGKLRTEERARNLQATGGLRKGGRPVRVQIDLEALAARWHAGESVTALRRHFRCGADRLVAALGKLRAAGRLDDEKRDASRRRKGEP